MRRITSLIMIAALLSVTSLPLLPQAKICHAAEHNADCGTCHTDPGVAGSSEELAHAMHAPGMASEHSEHKMQQGHQHGSHDGNMHHENSGQSQDHRQMHQHRDIEQPEMMHKHRKQLTSAEKECRIECGCGCNRSVDGFPHLLAPHLATVIKFENGERIVRSEPEYFPAPQSLTLSNPPPPPKTI